jgi:hypothetical protein
VRRIHLLLAALTIAVTSFAAFSGPAMADDWNNRGWNNDRNVVWQSNNGDWNNGWNDSDWNNGWNDSDWNDGLRLSSWDDGWNNGWNDDWNNGWNNHGFEGPVHLID